VKTIGNKYCLGIDREDITIEPLFHVVLFIVPLGRHRCRRGYNIKMDLQEVGCGSMDWIKLPQDGDRWLALANAVMNLQVP